MFNATGNTMHRASETEPFQRNRFFYGKMMGVPQCEMETGYLNAKRWMLNHVVLGYGVLCGLDVEHPDECGPTEIVLTPGIALDRWGREIVVPVQRTYTIPPDVIHLAYSQCEKDETAHVQVMLCYHECLTEPVPVLAGECGDGRACEPDVVRESYRVEFREGKCKEIDAECKLDHVFADGKFDYKALAQWVTNRPCPSMKKDPCICLANIRLTGSNEGKKPGKPGKGNSPPSPTPARPVVTRDSIDITVRRIVLTNRLMSDLLPCLVPHERHDDESTSD